MKEFIILHDTDRYGETKGSEKFGKRIIVWGSQEQTEEVAAALSGYFDAGLDYQFYTVGVDDL